MEPSVTFHVPSAHLGLAELSTMDNSNASKVPPAPEPDTSYPFEVTPAPQPDTSILSVPALGSATAPTNPTGPGQLNTGLAVMTDRMASTTLSAGAISTSQEGQAALVHPLMRQNAWNQSMVETNNMALSPDEYMRRIGDGKRNAIERIKAKLKEKTQISPKSSKKGELAKTEPAPTPQILQRAVTLDMEASTTAAVCQATDQGRDKAQTSYHSWIGKLLPHKHRSGRDDPKGSGCQGELPHGQSRIFTSDLNESSGRSGSNGSGASSSIPPPHKLHKMPSYTGLDGPQRRTRASFSKKGAPAVTLCETSLHRQTSRPYMTGPLIGPLEHPIPAPIGRVSHKGSCGFDVSNHAHGTMSGTDAIARSKERAVPGTQVGIFGTQQQSPRADEIARANVARRARSLSNVKNLNIKDGRGGSWNNACPCGDGSRAPTPTESHRLVATRTTYRSREFLYQEQALEPELDKHQGYAPPPSRSSDVTLTAAVAPTTALQVLSFVRRSGSSFGSGRGGDGKRGSGAPDTAVATHSRGNSGTVEVDFDTRAISFNDPALEFPKNKASHPQMEAAERTYDAYFERMRTHAIERAKTDQYSRPDRPYNRQAYLCASEPSEPFRVMYDPPATDGLSESRTVPKPAVCGPSYHDPSPYLDPILQQLDLERQLGLRDQLNRLYPDDDAPCRRESAAGDDSHHKKPSSQVQEQAQPGSKDDCSPPVPAGPRAFLNPRQAPMPPGNLTKAQSHQILRPQASTDLSHRDPRDLLYHARPRPLPIPPIEPGTSRRLSQEARFYIEQFDCGGNDGHGDSTDRASSNLSTCPSIPSMAPPSTPEKGSGNQADAKDGMKQFGLAATKLRAFTSNQQVEVESGDLEEPESMVFEDQCDSPWGKLSTIDERSETRSIASAFITPRQRKRSDTSMASLFKQQSNTVSPFDLGFRCQTRRASRRYSDPSIYSQDDPDSPQETPKGTPKDTPQPRKSVSLVGDRLSAVLEAAPDSDAASEHSSDTTRPLPPSPGDLDIPRDGPTTPHGRMRHRSFSATHAMFTAGTRDSMIEQILRDIPSAYPMSSSLSIGEFKPNDTPERQKTRMRMRNNQDSLLALEHLAFGGPPHRELQGTNRRPNIWTGPAGPPPDAPLPPDPPRKSPLRKTQQVDPSTPTKTPILRDVADESRTHSRRRSLDSPLREDVPGEIVSTVSRSSSMTRMEKVVSGLFATKVPAGLHTSLQSARSIDIRNSVARGEPREAGYAVSPLKIRKSGSQREPSSVTLAERENDVGRGMQDIIDAINMDAQEIEAACMDRISCEDVLEHSDKQSLAQESVSVAPSGASVRSERSRAPSSLHDVFRGRFSHAHGATPSPLKRSFDKERVSLGPSSSKLSARSNHEAVGVLLPVPTISSGTSSVMSDEDNRPSTANSKQSSSSSLLSKLKSKASMRTFSKDRTGRTKVESASFFSRVPAMLGKENRTRTEESENTYDLIPEETPAIPPLPQMDRLTMTVPKEDLAKYGLHPTETSPYQNKDVGEGAKREDDRQRALEMLEGPRTTPAYAFGPLPSVPDRQRTEQWPLVSRPQTPSKTERNIAATESQLNAEKPKEVARTRRDSLCTAQEVLLGTRSSPSTPKRSLPPPPMPPLPKHMSPPIIPARSGSRQSLTKPRSPRRAPATLSKVPMALKHTWGSFHSSGDPVKATSLPRSKMGAGFQRPGIPSFEPLTEEEETEGSENQENTRKPATMPRNATKKPSYGNMPESSLPRGWGHTPIDITAQATANPTEALASAATVMSLAPKAGSDARVQDKSLALSGAIPSNASKGTTSVEMPRPSESSSRRISPRKLLRGVGSTATLGSGLRSEMGSRASASGSGGDDENGSSGVGGSSFDMQGGGVMRAGPKKVKSYAGMLGRRKKEEDPTDDGKDGDDMISPYDFARGL